ncbi:unnamed protein product [Tuber aestivum]|uniref:Uncharacterized protein n=1 Tax=Tuber aestivum TaxID=59557 RepID=A0A292PYW9_9PEZI|nr:unnamed protein product [Tuber aestivum]
MDRPSARASAKKRKAGEAPEIPVEASKKTKLYNINRSSPDTISDNDDFQEEDTTAFTTTGHKIARVSNAKKVAPKAKINTSKNSKVTTKPAEIEGGRVAEAIISKQASNPTKTLKRKSTGGGSEERLGFALPAKKAKVGQSQKGETTGEVIEEVRNVGEVHKKPKVKETAGKHGPISALRRVKVGTAPQGEKVDKPAKTKGMRDNPKAGRVKDTARVTKAIIADNSPETSNSDSEIEITAPEGSNNVKASKDKTALNAGGGEPVPGKVAANIGLEMARRRIAPSCKALDKESIDVVENTVQDVGTRKGSRAKGFQQNENNSTSSQGSRFGKAKDRTTTNAIEGERNQVKANAKVPHNGPKSHKASQGETSTQDIVEIDEDHETPSSGKAKNNVTTTTKPISAPASQEAGGLLGLGVAKSISRDDLPEITSRASSRDGRAGASTSIPQISEVEPPRHPFIVTDPNKPRPRGLGRTHFEETPAYKNLMEVATQVKRAARILTKKLVSAKAASKNSSAEEQQNIVVNACEKVKKFVKIYSPQIKFLNAEEHTALLRAAVQCLGGAEAAELPNRDFQKVLWTFLEGMKLSESQAITVGLYPILEIYKMEEESGELGPGVKQLIASVNASLVRKSKAAEARLVDPDYLPEDYLTRMQKRVLAMGNVSKPISDEWEKFLKDSAPPKAVQRAQPLSYVDQVVPLYQPIPPTIKPKPARAKSQWEKNHMVSKIISKNRSNKRLETKIRNAYKVVREHKTYDLEQDDGEPTEYRSCGRPPRFDETKEARQILEYDAFGKPIWPNDAEEAGGSMVHGSFSNPLEFN